MGQFKSIASSSSEYIRYQAIYVYVCTLSYCHTKCICTYVHTSFNESCEYCMQWCLVKCGVKTDKTVYLIKPNLSYTFLY